MIILYTHHIIVYYYITCSCVNKWFAAEIFARIMDIGMLVCWLEKVSRLLYRFEKKRKMQFFFKNATNKF